MAVPPGPPATRSGLSATLFGADEIVKARATVSAPIPDARYALVRAAEASVGGRGEVEESAPGRFVWRGARTLERDTVSLEEHGDGTTTIEVRSDRMGRYLLGWGVAFIVLGAGLSYVGSPLSALHPILEFVVPAFLPVLVGRPFWKRSQRRARERLERSLADIVQLMGEEPASPPA